MKHLFKSGLAVFAFVLLTLSNQGATIEPVQCVQKVNLPDYNGVYECFHVCEDEHDPEPCPTCCPSQGGSGGGGGRRKKPKFLPGMSSFHGGGASPCKVCGGGGGGGGNECCEEGAQSRAQPAFHHEGGMAFWSVKEPRLNLFLNDKPFWYQPSRGPEMAFHLIYKNKMGTNGIIGTRQRLIFSVGTNWHTPWRSYLQEAPNPDWQSYFVYSGDGSVQEYIIGLDDPRTGVNLTNEGTTFTAKFNTGERRIFGPGIDFSGTNLWFLSRIEYPGGITNRFEYLITNDTVRLNKIIDSDNRETTFEYTNSTHYSNLISKVIGPFGQTAILTYTNGQLLSIKDMAGLDSKMEYDTTNRLSKLITPYGTNTFTYYWETNWNGLRVNEHGLRKHFYLRGDGPTNLFPAFASDYASLTNYLSYLSTNITETFDNTNSHQRNSYYWGPRQYANLSQGVRDDLDDFTFQIGDLSTNDFNKGRTRHWLMRDAGYMGVDAADYISDTVAMEREPSPNADGSAEGLIIWYDHLTKHLRDYEGNPQAIKTEAWRFAGTNWHVVNYQRHFNSRITGRKSNYGEPDAGQLKTVTYTLAANNIDVIALAGAGADNFTRTWDAFHQVVSNFNAIGEVTYSEYDSLHRLTNVTYPNGLVTRYTYDGNGYVSTVIDGSATAGLRTNSYTWTNGLVYTHTDERGLTVTNVYDVFGRLLRQNYPDGTYVTNVYDKLDVIQSIDRLGNTNRYEYNSFQQVVRQIDALNRTNTLEYCDCGSLNTATDPLGNATSYTTDNAGRQTRVTFPGASYVDYVYDTAGHLLYTSDSAGVRVTNHYRIEGLVYAVSNAAGQVFLKKFDDDGNVTWQMDEHGVKTAFYYDGLDRLTNRATIKVGAAYPPQEVYDWASFEAFFYTENISEPTSHEDVGIPAILRTTYSYDLFGRKTNEVRTDIDSAATLENTSFSYYPSGDLQTLTDGKGQTTTWKYDQYGHMTNKIDAASADMFRYAYDANGRLTNRWSPAKGTTKYSYDAVGNLTSIDYPASTDITMQYDGNNRITNMVDAAGTTRFTYASFGALLSEDGPWESDTVSYTHDNGRRRNGLSVQAPNATAWSQSYGYDSAQRLSSLTSRAGTFSYLYLTGIVSGVRSASPLIKRLSLPNGAIITNQYGGGQSGDLALLTETKLLNSGSATLSRHTYIYDYSNRRTNHVRTDGSYVDYGYDAMGQLKTALGRESGGTTNRWHEQFRYAYDLAGNLTNRVQNKLTNSFTLNSLNQLTGGSRGGRFTVAGTTTSPATNVTVNTSNSVLYLDYTFASTNHALSDGTNIFTAIGKDNLGRIDTNVCTSYLPASLTFAYDSNGNLIYDGHKALEYDDENQLTRIIATNLFKSEFTYDGKLRRRIRTEYTWQNSTWVMTNEVRYVYDGNLVIQERDNFNNPCVTYTRGTDLGGTLEGAGGIGGLLARTDHRSLIVDHCYYHADANGNVIAMIDPQANVVARYFYEPFGGVFSMSGPLAEANVYRFSSKETDPSGLVYYLYRYYDSAVQRWINRDPIHEAGGWNLYGFVNNNPVSHFDPFGLIRGSYPDPYCGAKCGKQLATDLSVCAAVFAAAIAIFVFLPPTGPIAAHLMGVAATCAVAAIARHALCIRSCLMTGQCPYPIGPYPGSWPWRMP